MGFRFSKQISVLPGVRVNVSKSGASLSGGNMALRVKNGNEFAQYLESTAAF